ncbi:hypothetical protein M9Y10_023200 [Tritrichomonas musculus]|uniref:Uncharacterized protein n=1 Tax=Tritrichomonas musculus TaxID=1915356 RepID=A0ABR2KUN3_9EUKA
MSVIKSLQGEINRLDDLIEQKENELFRLEQIVIKITEPKEIEYSKRKEIDRLQKNMEAFSSALSSFGLPPKTRIQSLTSFLEELFKQSQQIKAKRDRYANMIPIAEQQCAEMKQAVENQRSQIINDYSNQLQKFKEIRDLFNSLASSLRTFNPNYIIPMRESWNNFPYAKQGFSGIQNKLNAAADNTKKALTDERVDYEHQIAQVQAEIEKLKKQILQFQKRNEEAQKAYDESVRKAKECQSVKKRLEKYMEKERDFRQKTIKFCSDIYFESGEEILIKQNQKIDDFMAKLSQIHQSFKIISAELEAESNPIHERFTVKFKAKTNYTKLRRSLAQTIPTQEIPLYALTQTQLKKRYEDCKSANENLEATFKVRKEKAQNILREAQIRYEEARRNSK